ncbi:hypothetical protein KKD84_02535 [Patescibacteria group bacterium]|nr:hypothetical protein [Patescibacteria group bacterium]
MPQEGIITAPSYVPPAVMDYLSSPGITKENFTIKNKYQLNQKDIDFIFDIYWDIIEKKRAPNALAVELRDYFKRWPADKVNTLALAILGKQLAPLSNMISGIEQEIKDLGGKIEDYPKKKVVPQAVSVQELTDNLISDLRVVLPDKFLKHRLENIVISKIKGVRDDFEIKNHLIRGVKIGGLDIAPSLADQIIKYIDSVQGLVKIVEQTSRPSQPSITPQAPGATKVLAPKSEPEISEAVLKKETGRGQAFTVRPEDIDEIIREREKIIPSPVLGEFARLEKEIMQQSGLAFSDPNAQARLQSAIRARLRDVRDELETKNFLTRGPREGGLGLPKEKADALAELIDKMSQPLRERLVKMEKEKETEQIKKTERGKREEQDKEHQELDKRFAALTGRTPSPLPREKEEK